MSKPDFRIYTVIKRDGKDDYWLNLGVAFKHEDGEGYNLLLQAMPLDGKLVLRTYKDEPEQKGADDKQPSKLRAVFGNKK